jgi:hypothetical protein
MRTARIHSFQNTSGAKHLVFVEVTEGADLTAYEFDHLGDTVCDYLSALGFDGIVGAKSARTHLSDAELELELDDFTVSRRDGSQ